jgi:CheY-like chemotaxis protein
MKGLVTSLGASALALVRQYQPHAITLDLHLPDIDGWRVMERLKADVALRHIPVCVISTDESRERAFSAGALAFLAKPISSHELLDNLLGDLSRYASQATRKVLVCEPQEETRQKLVDCLSAKEIQVTAAAGLDEALDQIRRGNVDCLVASASMPEFPEAFAKWARERGVEPRRPAIVLYSEEDFDLGPWRRLSQAATISAVRSIDRVLDRTLFYLHRPIAGLPEEKRRILVDLHQSDKPLAGRKVLVVDDDIRNIFALSTVLEDHEMQVVSADNGRDAIRRLQEDPGIDIVLMDIMMPEMDGMETMREIRKINGLKDLPIVAVTAKAMKGDREKCIEAGAWDYLAKPVDGDQMLGVLRAWLHR